MSWLRLAVSGTHGSGKTTLVEAFVERHPRYRLVPEAHETLLETGSAFSDPPSISDFLEQLEHSIDTLHAHVERKDVIFDRCPLDFVAYIEVLNRRSRGDGFDTGSVAEDVEEAIRTLDLIVFLPLPPGDAMRAEYPALQRAVDRRLRSILLDDDLSLLGLGGPRVIEVGEPLKQRLSLLERAISGR